MRSVSCRFQIAGVPRVAMLAVDHCTLIARWTSLPINIARLGSAVVRTDDDARARGKPNGKLAVPRFELLLRVV